MGTINTFQVVRPKIEAKQIISCYRYNIIKWSNCSLRELKRRVSSYFNIKYKVEEVQPGELAQNLGGKRVIIYTPRE